MPEFLEEFVSGLRQSGEGAGDFYQIRPPFIAHPQLFCPTFPPTTP